VSPPVLRHTFATTDDPLGQSVSQTADANLELRRKTR
jgi:hypothetical protein